MRRLMKDQKGIVIAYITVFIVVIMVAIVWIIFNEVILNVSNYATEHTTESYGDTLTILITFWRATPVVLLLGAVMGALREAHKPSM